MVKKLQIRRLDVGTFGQQTTSKSLSATHVAYTACGRGGPCRTATVESCLFVVVIVCGPWLLLIALPLHVCVRRESHPSRTAARPTPMVSEARYSVI